MFPMWYWIQQLQKFNLAWLERDLNFLPPEYFRGVGIPCDIKSGESIFSHSHLVKLTLLWTSKLFLNEVVLEPVTTFFVIFFTIHSRYYLHLWKNAPAKDSSSDEYFLPTLWDDAQQMSYSPSLPLYSPSKNLLLPPLSRPAYVAVLHHSFSGLSDLRELLYGTCLVTSDLVFFSRSNSCMNCSVPWNWLIKAWRVTSPLPWVQWSHVFS